MNIALFYIILAVLIFVIYGSFMLSRRDYRKKNICPKVFTIPACYIITVFFIGALGSHLFFGGFPYWYLIFLAVPFLLALAGTITELRGTVICPRTPGGTPMCYLSLGFCSFLIGLKTLTLYI